MMQPAAKLASQLGDPSDDHARPLNVSRRSVLAGAIAGGLAATVGASTPMLQEGGGPSGKRAMVAGAPGVGNPPGVVRNVIFVVADGMAAGTLGLAAHYQRLMRGSPLEYERLGRLPGVRRSLMSTHSADSVVTDSAAASSAWSVGTKHRNGSLCITPDGERPCPWLIRCQQAGRGTGAVTTTTICHATPAGFFANVDERGEYAQIGRQLVDRKLDVAMGGGLDHVNPDWVKDQADVALLRTAGELEAWSGGPDKSARLLGLFNGAHMSMVLDRRPDEPTLGAMTKAALRRLDQHPGGFFLQVEAGRVDHAGHSNDAPSLLAEMFEFDRALAVASEYALARRDTLLLVTTDHATAGAAFTFYGRHGIQACRRLGEAKRSFEWVAAQVRALPSSLDTNGQAAEVARLLSEASGVTLGRELVGLLARHLAGETVDPSLRRNQPVCVWGSMLGNALGVQFVSPDHTADHVEVIAVGPGAQSLPSFVDNTELTGWMAGLMDLPPGRPVA
jgi:alkaline phosphatase